MWSYKDEGTISGILGILNHLSHNFLAVIAGYQEVGVLNKAKINKLTQVKFFPFSVSHFQ